MNGFETKECRTYGQILCDVQNKWGWMENINLMMVWRLLALIFLAKTVHEKSILLPLLPASFLAIDEPFLFKWMMHYALLSMFPLMCRDELILPYISLSALFILLYHAPGGRKEKRVALSPSNLKSFVVVFLVLCSLILHVVYLVVSPPEKYPFLFEAMIVLLCFSQFLFIAGYTNIKQWMTLKDSALENKEKKHLWSFVSGIESLFLTPFYFSF